MVSLKRPAIWDKSGSPQMPQNLIHKQSNLQDDPSFGDMSAIGSQGDGESISLAFLNTLVTILTME